MLYPSKWTLPFLLVVEEYSICQSISSLNYQTFNNKLFCKSKNKWVLGGIILVSTTTPPAFRRHSGTTAERLTDLSPHSPASGLTKMDGGLLFRCIVLCGLNRGQGWSKVWSCSLKPVGFSVCEPAMAAGGKQQQMDRQSLHTSYIWFHSKANASCVHSSAGNVTVT